MSNAYDFSYYEATELPGMPVMHIPGVESFIKFAKKNGVEFIFKIINEGKTVEFFCPVNGIVYKTGADAYLTLADMNRAQQNGFPSADEFYEASRKGYKKYQEFLDYNNTGEEDKPELEAAYKAGFGDGFASFRSKYEGYRKNAEQSAMPDDLDNPLRLYRYALKKGIASFANFEKVYDAGYADLASFDDAKAKGFKTSTEYYEGRSKGFGNPGELAEATKMRIETKKDFEKYRFLRDAFIDHNFRFDEVQLIQSLAAAENGKLFTPAEMKSMLEKAQESYRTPSGHGNKMILPVWYSHHLEKEEAFLRFLNTNEEVNKIGYFSAAKKVFKVFKPSPVKILVDGSNIAHNNKNKEVKPELRFVSLVVKELHRWKFKNVTVISDATLISKVKDPFYVKELEKQCTYIEAPEKKEADEYLIKAMDKEQCGIVTNDKYRDWIHDFKWLPQKLESIRVEFEITKQDKVILRGMDKFRESTERD